jgi:hypothetical protein
VLRRGAIEEARIARQILATMSIEKEHMRGLIDRLMRLARLYSEAQPNIESVDVAELLRAQCEAARRLDDRRASDYSVDGLKTVVADKGELGEAVWNAIENALKYAPDAPIHLSARRNNGHAIITTKDEGPGMSESGAIARLRAHHAEKGLKPWGPSWVGEIVNAIGESPLWPNSVIVVLWDDWGGWYDPATPPPADFRGPGIRTPMLVISPYVPPANAGAIGHVSTEEFSSGSILKFIEQVYFKGETLGSLPCKANDYYYYYGCDLGYTDGTDPNTNSIGDVLNMNLAPRAYIPVSTKYPPSTFENSGNSYYYTHTAPDDQ